jgi:glycyl-tRNA synthetase
VAPVKFSVLPLITSSAVQKKLCQEVRALLQAAGASTKLDMVSENIGRRYARTDEIGIPFGVTVDTTSETDRTVTLRERDSMAQVRLPIEQLRDVAAALLIGTAWSDVVSRFNLPTYVHEASS